MDNIKIIERKQSVRGQTAHNWPGIRQMADSCGHGTENSRCYRKRDICELTASYCMFHGDNVSFLNNDTGGIVTCLTGQFPAFDSVAR